mgnify:CR=1 FL=1
MQRSNQSSHLDLLNKGDGLIRRRAQREMDKNLDKGERRADIGHLDADFAIFTELTEYF